VKDTQIRKTRYHIDPKQLASFDSAD
jgi:hypothetical protein